MGTRYVYTALAQEKTGGFWVDGRLFGDQACHPTEDVEHADFLLVIGANPWQSHGFPRARQVLQEIAERPEADARCDRSAPHRNGRAGRYTPGGAARRRRASAAGDAGRDRARGLLDHDFIDAGRSALPRSPRRLARHPGRRICSRGGSRSRSRAQGARVLRPSGARLRSNRPGARTFAAQHAEYLSGQVALSVDGALWQAGRQCVSLGRRAAGASIPKTRAKGDARRRVTGTRRDWRALPSQCAAA